MSDRLVLTIEVDDLGTNGWREGIEDWSKDLGMSFEEAMLDDLQDTFCLREVHVVLCGIPGEKGTNEEFQVHVKPGRIIGATLRATP